MTVTIPTMLIDHAIETGKVAHNALQGKVALVTGAGQGIGRETARVLARLGAHVVIAELNASGADAERAIRAEDGVAFFVQTDVSDPAAMQRLQEQVSRRFGDVDILVNNAEAFKACRITDLPVEEWDRIVAVNLRGAFLAIKAFLPAMLRKGDGVIITMESADAMPFMAPYVASKVGLRAVAQSLALEVGEQSGVAVYCFGAGMVNTPGAMRGFGALAPLFGMTVDEFIAQSAPGGRLAEPEEVAAGMAGTILHARDFHGQETFYTAGLSLLGLDAAGAVQPATAKPGGAGISRADYERALALNRKLEDIIKANIKEYDSLTMFMKQWVKRDFQQKTGLKVEDWKKTAEDMSRKLKAALEAGGGQPAAIPPSELTAYAANLDKMLVFIAKQEADARGWIKEPDKLAVALAALDERKQTVQVLAKIMHAMAG